MSDLHKAAQQVLEALFALRALIRDDALACSYQTLGQYRTALLQAIDRAALAQQAEPVACPCGDRSVDQCPGKWEPGCDLGGNQRYARRAVQQPQTLDAAMQQPRAMAQAYENGYKAGAAAEREACAKVCYDKANETFSGHCQVWGDYFARAIERKVRGEE